ncbi:MAG TPA: ABC transporter permease [Bryobacteraceae bacterium]|nr:ABC transporter permease [Bryobacteraceae bacterium]
MRLGRILAHRWQSLFRRSRAEAELQREIALHIEQLAKEYRAAGMSESEALSAARRDFGPAGVTKEQCRDMRGTRWIEECARDLAFGFRALKKSPGFTLTALLSLALGIGANTAIYSFMDAIMLRALPVPDPQNLVVLNWRAKGWPKVAHSQYGDLYKEPGGVRVSGTFPYPFFESLGEHNDVLSALFAFAGADRLNLVVGSQALLGEGEYVSGNYFSSIGAPPAVGRLIGSADDRAGANAVAVISYRFWQHGFNGASSAVGQTILVNRTPFTVVGVTAPEFYGVNPRSSPDIYLALHSLAYIDRRAQQRDWFHERDNYWVEMMGRLRPGVTLRQAEAALAGRFHLFVADTATTDKEHAYLPKLWLQEGGSGIDSLRRQYSKPLRILAAMTGLILAIACCNIANLLLSRATARRREIAVRLSLGAGRWRIVRQLLTESILLALAGGLLGLVAAAFGIHFLTWLLVNGRENFTLCTGIDARILLFTALVSVLTGILFGLAPAIQATKVNVAPALRESRIAALRVRRFGLPLGLNHALVAGQIALSLLLVIAAGLFVRTLVKLHSVSIGFNAEKLMVFNLNATQAGYDQRRAAAFYETLRQRFANLPGVRAATVTDTLLVTGSSSSISILVPGRPAAPDQSLATRVAFVGPGFFETMQIPILRGRPVGVQDTADAPHVAVVNEVFAKELFPGRNVIGQHFAFEDKEREDAQIVGVARNTRYSSLKDDIPPVAYVPLSQPLQGLWMIGGVYYEIRTLGDPLALAKTVRQVVHQANPRIPVTDLRTHVSYIESTIAPERAFAKLCTCFGLLALLIACVGLYGMMAYTVARRTNEIGIRIALGAQGGRVIWMVQREVLALSLAGVAIGLSVAWEMAHFVASFLFGIRPDDLMVFALSAVILVLCALGAGYAPAWRASRIDPMEALRNE